MMKEWLAIVTTILFLGGCSLPFVNQSKGEDVTQLQIEDIETGSGTEAQTGDTVAVHYTGWLTSGKQFDSSRGKSPFTFTLGEGEVISGWDQGVVGMKEGGSRRLSIPPELAYGDSGIGGIIPGGATLIFEVELVEVK